MFTVKENFFIEVSADYIHPLAKEFINTSHDELTDIDYLLVNVLDEFIDFPCVLKITDPKVAYTHLGMIIDMCQMSLSLNLN